MRWVYHDEYRPIVILYLLPLVPCMPSMFGKKRERERGEMGLLERD